MSVHTPLNVSLRNTLRVEAQTRGGAIARIRLSVGSPTIHPLLAEWFDAYLEGETAPLPPLHWPNLSPFSLAVLDKIADIPLGKTAAYSALHSAARAVGSVCNKNPFPLLIPCHRVVGKANLGGYAFGTQIKQLLLDYEKCVA